MEEKRGLYIRLAYLGWGVSLIVHLLAMLNIVLYPRLIPTSLFALILLLYLQSSRTMRTLLTDQPDYPLWRTLWLGIAEWQKWLMLTLIGYTIFTFLYFHSGRVEPGYLNFDVGADRLRIASAILLVLFAAIIILLSGLKKIADQNWLSHTD